MDDEIRTHIDLRVEQLVRQGLTPEEALEEAGRRFGLEHGARPLLQEAAARREGVRARSEWLDALRHDLLFALRQLGRAPGFAVAAVVTLALGIGANATMFGVVDRLLLRPPPHVADAERLVRFYVERTASGFGGRIGPQMSYAAYEAMRDSVPGVSAVTGFFPRQMVVGEGDEARPAALVEATGNFFVTLGARPQLGRFFTPDEDRPPLGARVVVLSDAYWRSRFGGARDVLGRTVMLEGNAFRIIGVAPAGFTGVDLDRVDLFAPLSAIASQFRGGEWHREQRMAWIRIVARMRVGVDRDLVASQATTALRAQAPDSTSFDYRATVIPSSVMAAREPMESERRSRGTVAAWLSGVAAIVLIIACANVANLLLLRGLRRRREVAVRLALGIGRARLLRQLLTESIALAVLGGGVGIMLAYWGGAAVRAALLPDIDWSGGVVDSRLLLFALAATLVTGVVMGLVPALSAAANDIVTNLKSGAREGVVRRSPLRTSLLVAQTGLTVLLLLGAGLFVRSLHEIGTLDYGYEPDRVLVADPVLASGLSGDARMAAYDRMLERARTLRSVEVAALTTTTPFWSMAAGDLVIPDFDSLAALDRDFPLLNAVSVDYFRTMGIRIVRGRAFTGADAFGAPRVAIVNEAMARRIWKGRDPIGRCLKVGGDTVPCSEIVGVARSIIQNDLRESPMLQYYIPIEQRQAATSMRGLVLRARGHAEVVAEPIRRELTASVPAVRYLDVRPLQRLIDPQVRPWRLGATMFGVFGGLALLIAAVGLYSVMAYEVAQRSHEMGVRVALGASARDLVRMVVGKGLRVVAIGLTLGVLVAFLGDRWIAPLLFHVPSRDPAVFMTVAVTLLLATLAATIVPALRASRADPLATLRVE